MSGWRRCRARPSGKLDRRALPEPVWREAEGFQAPQGAVEELLAALWAELLGRDRVGRHDNFFALGGDSILSIQLVARARAAGLELTPRQIFQQQTLAKLAETAGRRPTSADQPTSYGLPVPLTPVQHWFFAQQGPLRHFNRRSCCKCRRGSTPRGLSARLPRSPRIRRIADRVFAARALAAADHAAGRGRTRAAARPSRFSSASAAARAARLEEASARLQASLDPVHGPLWRAMWFDHGESPGRLLLAIHHLAVDAVSWRILVGGYRRAPMMQAGGAPRRCRHAPRPSRAGRTAGARGLCPGHTRRSRLLAIRLRRAGALPQDHAAPASNRVADSERLTLALDAGTTQHLLRDALRTYRAEINDMPLTALALAATRWRRRATSGGGASSSSTSRAMAARTSPRRRSVAQRRLVHHHFSGAAGARRARHRRRARRRRGSGRGTEARQGDAARGAAQRPRFRPAVAAERRHLPCPRRHRHASSCSTISASSTR